MVTTPGPGRTSVLVDSLVQLSFALQDLLARAAAEHDLSVTQLRLLGILRDRTPPMTALAEHLGLDRSSVTGLIDRAQGRGLVTRTASSLDARVTIVSVTAKGRRVGGQVAARVASEIDALVGHLPKADRDCMVRVAKSVLLGAAAGREPAFESR
jgi:DNA-binding MarR family transcriptional regulator